MRAMSRPLTTSLTALALLAGARALPAQDMSDDRDRIATLSSQAATGDWKEQREAISELAETHGPYAVNGLLRWIGGRADVENRVQAVYSMRRLGSGAEYALLAGLHSEDPMVRRNLCMVLAAVGTPNSVPMLNAVAQHDADPLARQQAMAALSNLGSVSGSVAGQLAGLADQFSAGSAGSGTAVFFWDGKQVASRATSEALFPYAMARLFAEDALRIEPGNAMAQAALVTAYQGMFDAIAAGDDSDWEESQAAIADLLALGGVVPAMEDQDAAEAPEPMAGAYDLLRSDDKRLRYKAALSLSGPGAGSDVVAVLADALSESAVRQILVVDNDRNELNELVAMLTGRETYAVGAPTGAQGLMRAKATPVKDVVILRSSLTDVPADQIIQNLSRDVRTKDVPVIVVAPESDLARLEALLGDRVVGVVPAPITMPVLKPALEAAFEMVALNEQRLAAEDFSRMAAEALSQMDGSSLSFISDALVGAIGRDDKVQIPALLALSKVGAAEGQAPATMLFVDTTASTEARVAAANALAGILARNEASPATMTALEAALAGSDADIKSAAAKVLGAAASLAMEDRSKLLLANGVRF